MDGVIQAVRSSPDRPARSGALDARAPVLEAVQAYAGSYPSLRRATEEYTALITTLLDDAGINYLSITGRAKSVASFAAKAVREVDGRPVYDEPLTQITDQIGVRVITYLRDDVDAVAILLGDQWTVLDDRDMGQETAADGRWGYASRHLVLDAQAPADLGTPDEELLGHVVSVQVRTVLQHAWAEFEHDVRYKGTVPIQQAADLNRRFALAAGLLELADREFTEIRDRVQATMTADQIDSDNPTSRISTAALTAFLAGRYVTVGWSRTDHYTWIAGLLADLGIRSLADLDALLGSVDEEIVNERMGYRHPARAVRRLDDALLAVFGIRYINLDGNAHRRARLTTRLGRIWPEADVEGL
jgi:ppGpp synthetase/RelA/SpoT-type nucleotidyltranferase